MWKIPPFHSDCPEPWSLWGPHLVLSSPPSESLSLCLDPMSGLSPVFLWEDPCTFLSKWEWRGRCQEDVRKRNRRKRAIEKLLLIITYSVPSTVLDAENAVTLQVLTTISYNSNITPCVQGMKLLKQECGSKLYPSPSSPSQTGFSALRLSLSLCFGLGMVAWLANPHMWCFRLQSSFD